MQLEQTDDFKERKRKAYHKYVMDGLRALPNYSFFHNSDHKAIFEWERKKVQRRYMARVERALGFRG